MDVVSLRFSTALGTVSLNAALPKGSHCSLGGWTKRRVKHLCQHKQLQQLRSHQGHPKHQEIQVPAPGLSPPQPPRHHKEQHQPGPFSCPSTRRASTATITRECWAAPAGVVRSSKGSSAVWNVRWVSAGIARTFAAFTCDFQSVQGLLGHHGPWCPWSTWRASELHQGFCHLPECRTGSCGL